MKKYKLSLIFNLIIFILVIVGIIFMTCGIKIMGEDIVLTKSSLEAFKYFTVDSNLLMGIAAIVFAYYDYLVITKKKKEIPESIYVFKHIATASVLLTFAVTVFYLAPFSEFEFLAFFRNSNLFFHLIVPILSVIVYVLYEKKNQDSKVVKYGLIPMGIYAVFYTLAYLTHLGSDSVNDYDWYKFFQHGVIGGIISLIAVLLGIFLISYFLWIYNKRNYKK